YRIQVSGSLSPAQEENLNAMLDALNSGSAEPTQGELNVLAALQKKMQFQSTGMTRAQVFATLQKQAGIPIQLNFDTEEYHFTTEKVPFELNGLTLSTCLRALFGHFQTDDFFEPLTFEIVGDALVIEQVTYTEEEGAENLGKNAVWRAYPIPENIQELEKDKYNYREYRNNYSPFSPKALFQSAICETVTNAPILMTQNRFVTKMTLRNHARLRQFLAQWEEEGMSKTQENVLLVIKLSRPITVNFKETPLSEVQKKLTELLEIPVWGYEFCPNPFAEEETVSFSCENMPAYEALYRLSTIPEMLILDDAIFLNFLPYDKKQDFHIFHLPEIADEKYIAGRATEEINEIPGADYFENFPFISEPISYSSRMILVGDSYISATIGGLLRKLSPDKNYYDIHEMYKRREEEEIPLGSSNILIHGDSL
ncbi:MAG: hypothetical protein Q4C70_12935, partial [Planctomycetia bacterium]|nr:hypothetical protein [Planctomycetia bacterium]